MYKEICEYLTREIYPFHMPGHKRNPEFFPRDFFSLDLTELPETDILSQPKGMIKNLQKKIANFYGAGESFFLVNGASSGIVAAICATCNEKTPLFVPRNAHVSLYNGLVFSGAKPTYYFPEITSCGIAAGVEPKIFDTLPHGAVVFVVSPTYEGFVSDIAAIAKKVHAHDGVLIVDEAHGAHFAFHDYFPATALSCGADIVINSLHKTLPAMSGCAVLHTKKNFSRLQFFINAMQTTSPSFAMLAACDFMLEKLWHDASLFEKYISRLEDFRENAPPCLYGREMVGQCAIHDMDLGKLFFSCAKPAEKIAEVFARDHKVQLEMAKGNHFLAMTSVADTQEGFDRLKAAVSNVDAGKIFPRTKINLPEQMLTPREAMLGEHSEQISAKLIAEYPPGIATLVPGERNLHAKI